MLELIMTAPMVVASWINLQYFGSTTNNKVFGSGNKTLHNVVGQIGVLEGNAGDLRRSACRCNRCTTDKRFVHEPLRLNVLIEAPEEAIDSDHRKACATCGILSATNGFTSTLSAIRDGSSAVVVGRASGKQSPSRQRTGISTSSA